MVDLPHRLGKYTLHRRLGGGGMGQVYLANLEGAGGFTREIAVKLIRAELADSRRANDMFMREGRALATLSHRNVVQVFELAAEGEHLYLAMEYLRGLDLGEIRARGPLAWLAAAYIGSEAARGLASAHAARSADAPSGIVHGDISPSNVMACLDGGVKVLDFGIARPVGRTAGSVTGKLPYLPPEVIVGAAADERTDIYGLGIVLYELITGERLFRAGSDPETTRKVMHDIVPPPSVFVRDISPVLDGLVMSMIARDRTARPAAAAELADALDRFVDGRFGAADLASLVESLSGRPALRSNDVGTPLGRTESFGSHTVNHTALVTPAPSRTPAPNRRRLIVGLAAGTVMVAGLGVWRLVPWGTSHSRSAADEPRIVPMHETVAAPPSPSDQAATVEPQAEARPPVVDEQGVADPAKHPARRKRAPVADRTRGSTRATAQPTTRPPTGSGSISPGYLANPFEKKKP